MGRRYSKFQRKQIQGLYLIAAVLWIFTTYALGVYKSRSIVTYLILAFPLFVYALGFLNSVRITSKVNREMGGSDFLALGLLFITVLFDITSHHSKHYTVNIIIFAFVLIIFSTVDIWTGERGLLISRHVRSIARTASVSLLVFVIYVNITEGVSKLSLIKPLSPRLDYSTE